MTTTRPVPHCPARPWPLDQVETGLDAIDHRRSQLMSSPATPWRAAQLAALAATEATWWEAVSERARARVHWRAALLARERALHTARHWHHRAASPATRPTEEEVA